MAKRKKSRRNKNTYSLDFYNDLSDSNNSNIHQTEPQIRKSFHIRDLSYIRPKTDNQQLLFDLWKNDKSFLLSGSAGTGKTFLAMYLSLCNLLDDSFGYKQLVIVRSAVQARDIGMLPGDVTEKLQQYKTPYMTICDQLFPWKKSYENMEKIGLIKFECTSFLRGCTFDDSIIIVDECQNMTWEELSTVITRVGENTKIIFCGDIKQNDLYRKKNDTSGFDKFKKVLTSMIDHFDAVEFNHSDIVRSSLVKDFIIKSEYLD